MTDIRHYVEENRGLLKKIELSIPGFRGYRIREDLRAADNILRSYIADQIEREIQKPLERIREKLAKTLEMDIIGDVGDCISQIKGLGSQIRHAENGYSGVSPQLRIEEKELNQIYESDVNLINRIQDIRAQVLTLDEYIITKKMDDLKLAIEEIQKEVIVVESIFNQRIQFISITDN